MSEAEKEADRIVKSIYKKVDFVTVAMPEIKRKLSKELAIDCVDEILKSLDVDNTLFERDYSVIDSRYRYYEQVKSEIKKL